MILVMHDIFPERLNFTHFTTITKQVLSIFFFGIDFRDHVVVVWVYRIPTNILLH